MIGNQIAYEQKHVASVDLVLNHGCTNLVFTEVLTFVTCVAIAVTQPSVLH